MVRFAFNAGVVLALTILTQIGGLAWLVACGFRRRLLAFLVFYIFLSVSAVWIAPQFGRVALSCFERGTLQVHSFMYCALNRTYVTPELAEVLSDASDRLEQLHPGTVTLVLDAGFPFADGFPLLPHLSHHDGEKADIALFYADEFGYLPGRTRSPIGYFAFETGPTDCAKVSPTLRWDMEALQPYWHDYALERDRTRAVLQILAADLRVGKVLLEPHLTETLGVVHEKIRFQGCRAARHDDHIHLQLE